LSSALPHISRDCLINIATAATCTKVLLPSGAMD
jgi:hypothetical protein